MDIIKKNIFNIVENKIVLIISIFMLMTFSFPYSENAMMIGMILGIGTVVMFFVLSRYKKSKNNFAMISTKEIITSIVALLYFSICFYDRYKEFGAWISLGDKMHCPPILLLIGAIVVLAIGSFPIIFVFCHHALNNAEDVEEGKFSTISKIFIYIGIGSMFLFCFSKYLWIDESFSLSLIDHDYKTLVALAAKDVHPPLYYIILKFVVDVTYKILPFSYTRIYFAKLVSVIPYVFLLIVGEKYISKKYGRYVATIFEVLILGMSNFTNYSVEIRMYSLALLFTTIAFGAYVEIIENTAPKLKHWIIFVLSSILAAYTHYYACIAVAFLYIILFVKSLKNKKEMVTWTVCSIITVVAYLPWLGILLSQFSKVSSGYWIESIGFRTIWNYTVFVFGYYNVFPIVLVGIVNYWVNKEKYNVTEKYIIITGLLMPVWVAAIGLTVSYLIRPVFVPRYLFATLGAFWLAFALINNKNRGKKSFQYINVGLLIFALVNMSVFWFHEVKDWKNGNEIYEVVGTMEEDSAIYSNSPQGALFVSLITGEKVHTVPVFSDYEDQIYKNHVIEIENVKEIENPVTYCFWLADSEHGGVEFEEELGDFFEEKAFTLYRYKKGVE